MTVSSGGATGSAYYIVWESKILSVDYRTADTDEEMGTVDQSAGADTDRTFLTTLKGGGKTYTGKHDAGDTTLWFAIKPGTEGTLEWGEEGTTATCPKHTVNAIVTNRHKGAAYDGLVVISASWIYSGAVTDGTY